jgi:hypothetical protein
MPTRLTVAEARSQLYQQVDPSDVNSNLFLPALNKACERLLQAGTWAGTQAVVDFDASDNYITLPRRYEAIQGCTKNGAPAKVVGRLHEYLSSGPGFYANLEYDIGLLIDQGEFPTMVPQDEAHIIRLTIANAADEGHIVRLFGVANGDTVFDSDGNEGIALTLTDPTVDTNVEMIVTAVTKDVTVGNVTLSTVDGGTVTPLSTYEPTEVAPLYRRYKTGTVNARTDSTPVIRTLCKRRFVPLVNKTDLVYPGSLGALSAALNAVQLERQGVDELKSAELFWQKAYDILNAELRQQRGNIRRVLNVDCDYGGRFAQMR